MTTSDGDRSLVSSYSATWGRTKSAFDRCGDRGVRHVTARNVIVVGTPRSGTSMAAYVFARQGYFAAQDESELRPGDRHNPSGYWEAERLIEANVDIFAAVGYPHHNTWLYEPLPEAAARHIADLTPTQEHRDLLESYETRRPWLWKDPRLCYTLAYWWKLIRPGSTSVLLIRRNPEHVFQSFVRMSWRNNTPAERDETIARLQAHLAAAERTLRELDIPHVAVKYEDFHDAPDRVARELGATFGLDLRGSDLGFEARRDHNHDRVRGRLSTRIQRSGALVNQILHGR